MNKVKLALIGKDVSKSDSQKIHEFILKKWGYACEYELISLPKANLNGVLSRLFSEFDGFNVTIPYKMDVLPYLEEIKDDALAFGAVNTVVCKTKKGYNTDGVGFLQMLKTEKIELNGKKILVLGAGGSGRSTAVSLKNAGADVFLYRRNQEELEKTCAFLGVKKAVEPENGGYDIVINATGVGMHDTVGVSPVSAQTFSGAELAIDLIYVPSESEFLRLARGAGLRVLNGAPMLFYQGYFSDCLYLGKEPNEDEAKKLYSEFLKKSEKEKVL